jgi:prepilin-type N-terminal cleavage/methylation domain-containing protein
MKHRYFTLMELLVTIGLIAILAAISFGGMRYASARADEAKTLATMEEFMAALEAFKQDYGYYPVVEEGTGDGKYDVDFSRNGWKLFKNEETKPNKRNKAYMENIPSEKLNDAYGSAIQYRYPGDRNPAKYDVWSRGKDGKNGFASVANDTPGSDGSDDICSWKQR